MAGSQAVAKPTRGLRVALVGPGAPQSRAAPKRLDLKAAGYDHLRLENAAEAFTRATNCNDADWQKFHLGTAAACKEWALQLEPLVSIQARIDEKVAMIRRRFHLGPQPRREASRQTGAATEDVVTAPETIAASATQPAAWFRPRL